MSTWFLSRRVGSCPVKANGKGRPLKSHWHMFTRQQLLQRSSDEGLTTNIQTVSSSRSYKVSNTDSWEYVWDDDGAHKALSTTWGVRYYNSKMSKSEDCLNLRKPVRLKKKKSVCVSVCVRNTFIQMFLTYLSCLLLKIHLTSSECHSFTRMK